MIYNKKNKKYFAFIIAFTMVLSIFTGTMDVVHAESEQNVSVYVGADNIIVKASYIKDGETVTEEVVSSNGVASFKELTEYLEYELKFNEETSDESDESDNTEDITDPDIEENPEPVPEPIVKELDVTFDVNYSQLTEPLDKDEAGGNGRYEGDSMNITLTPENYLLKNLLVVSQIEFVEGSVSYSDKGDASDVAVHILHKNGQYDINTDANGEFDAYPIKKSDLINISVEQTEEYEGVESDGSSSNFIMKKKEEAEIEKEFTYGDNIVNGYVKEAGTYTIKGVNGCTISTGLFDEYEEEIDITIDANGNTPKVFVKKSDGTIRLPIENILKIDDEAPALISSDINETAGSSINFLPFGMFSNDGADITINATVQDDAAGVDRIVIKSGEKTYEPLSVSQSEDKMSANFLILNATEDELHIVVIDKLGNESEEVLVRETNEASKLTIENIPPAIHDIQIEGNASQYDWYNDDIILKSYITDENSGLFSTTVSASGVLLNEKKFSQSKEKFFISDNKITKEWVEKHESKDGRYIVSFYAEDNAGNKAIKMKEVKIDVVEPVLTLSGVESNKHYNVTPVLKISSNERNYSEKGAYIGVRIEKDGKIISDKIYKETNSVIIDSCSSDGEYNIICYSKDAAENSAKAKHIEFTVDKTAPVISISGAEKGEYYNTQKNISVSIKEKYFKTNDVKIVVTKTVEGKTTTESFPWKNSSANAVATKCFSETGEYNITVTATDEAGNKAVSKKFNFTVDTENPTINFNGVKEGQGFGYDSKITPSVTFKDSFFAVGNVSIVRSDGQKVEIGKSGSLGVYGGTISINDFPKNKEYDGIYTLTATGKDKAGNSVQKKITFYVNRFGSTFKYDSYAKSVNGKYFKEIEKDIIVSEYNVTGVSSSEENVYLDGVINRESTVKKNTVKETPVYEYSNVFYKNSFDAEGVYRLNIASKDNEGNLATSEEKSGELKFIVDKTKPQIQKEDRSKQRFDIEKLQETVIIKDNLSPVNCTVYVNDKKVLEESFDSLTGEINYELGEGLNQDVKIVTVDAAGNENIYEESNITVSTNAFIRLIGNPLFFPVIVILILIILSTIFFIIWRKKKAMR